MMTTMRTSPTNADTVSISEQYSYCANNLQKGKEGKKKKKKKEREKGERW